MEEGRAWNEAYAVRAFLTFNRTYQIQTRSPYLPVTRVSSKLMQPGEAFSVDPSLLSDLVQGSGFVSVGFSSIPEDRVEPGIEKLAALAHTLGCNA